MTSDDRGRYVPDIQVGKIQALNCPTFPGLDSGLGSLGSLNQWALPQMAIPMRPEDWKKLSRETQIKLLDELGILNADSSKG